MAALEPSTRHFAGCSIDLRARRLSMHGDVVRVEPKVFDLIAYLIVHADRAIGRDELISAVWASSDVSDAVLGQAVRKARKALGDSGDGQNTIQTIVRFGYRWVAAPVLESPLRAESTSTAVTPAAEPAPASTAAVSTPSRSYRVHLVIVALLAIAAILAYAFQNRRSADVVGESAAVAVLPARVESTDPGDRWTSIGIMALLRERLAASTNARMIANSDVLTLVPANRTVVEPALDRERIRRGSGARWVLQTTVASARATRTITFELFDGEVVAARGSAATHELEPAVDEIVQQIAPLLGRPRSRDAGAKPYDVRYSAAVQDVLGGNLAAAHAELVALEGSALPRVQVQTLLAEVERRLGQADNARQRLRGVVLPTSSADSDPGNLEALRELARIDLQQRHLDDAETEYTDLLKAAQHSRSTGLRADALSGLAFIAARRLDFAKADDFYARARTLRHSLGDRLALARQDANEGVLASQQGRSLLALERLRSANEVFVELGLRQETAMTLFDMAEANADRGRLGEQRALLAASLAIDEDIGDAYGALKARVGLMNSALRNGDFSEGLQRAPALIDESRRLGYAIVEADALTYEGQLHAARSEWNAAEGMLRQAIELCTKEQAFDGVREATWSLAEVLAASGRKADALALLDHLPADGPSPLTRAGTALHRGNVFAMAGDQESANAQWEAAYRGAQADGIEPVMLQAAIASARGLVASTRLAQAEPLIAQVSAAGDELFEAQSVLAAYFAATGDAEASDRARARAMGLRGERDYSPRERH